MPRQANGTYLPPANTAAVSGSTISSTAFNALETDVGNEITNSLDRAGRSGMTAALPMGGQQIISMADPINPTDGATKNYVDTTTATLWSTGDVKLTLKNIADPGWILFDDGTFGNVGSGSSSSANPQNQALFTLFFNLLLDTGAPIFTAGGSPTTRAGQVNAASAWAALCRMSLPRSLGRAIAIAGNGSGLTSRPLGSFTGSETASLVTANLPPYTPTGTVSGAATSGATVLVNGVGAQNMGTGSAGYGWTNVPTVSTLTSLLSWAGSFLGVAQGGTSTPFTVVQPEFFLNAMVKR